MVVVMAYREGGRKARPVRAPRHKATPQREDETPLAPAGMPSLCRERHGQGGRSFQTKPRDTFGVESSWRRWEILLPCCATLSCWLQWDSTISLPPLPLLLPLLPFLWLLALVEVEEESPPLLALCGERIPLRSSIIEAVDMLLRRQPPEAWRNTTTRVQKGSPLALLGRTP